MGKVSFFNYNQNIYFFLILYLFLESLKQLGKLESNNGFRHINMPVYADAKLRAISDAINAYVTINDQLVFKFNDKILDHIPLYKISDSGTKALNLGDLCMC